MQVDVRTILPWKDAQAMGVSEDDYKLANGKNLDGTTPLSGATNRLNLLNAWYFVNGSYLSKINEGALAPVLLN